MGVRGGKGSLYTTRPGFHGVILDESFRLRHAILLPAAEMCCLFWLRLLWSTQVALWREGDSERKGGVKVQTKGSHRDSLSVIKFVEAQKELQTYSQEHLEGETRGLEDSILHVRTSAPPELSRPTLSLHFAPHTTAAQPVAPALIVVHFELFHKQPTASSARVLSEDIWSSG